MNARRALLDSIVDYAGLFPPAALGMQEAVRNYADYRRGARRWALGRFVVPAVRLAELPPLSQENPWPLSVVGKPPEFRRRDAVIEALEVKAGSVAEIERAPTALPCFVEVPIREELLEAIKRAGAMAKVRLSPPPPAADVGRFLTACAAMRLPFKATGGLHHPVRLAGSDHGFLNVFLAAAFVRGGMDAGEAARLLDETDPAALEFDDRAARWRGRSISTEEIAATRRTFALSFGSCSFSEPMEALGL